MRFKNIFQTTLLALAVVTLNTACTFEQEDFFDESASLRITHLNEQLQERLVSQSSGDNHGWVIQYFVAGTDEMTFEGFNLFGKFYDNEKVTLASDHRYLRNGNAGKFTEFTSSYQMLAEEGPVLAFNTWNDILTVFVDPVSPSSAPSSIVNDGEGMKGDNNLVLKSFEDDEILFRGERHGAEVRLVPCDRSWEDYIAATAELKNNIASASLTSYYVTNGVDTMYFSGLNQGVFIYGERVVDPLNRKTLSCVFTPDGFRINHVDTLAGNPFQQFTITEDKTKLLSEDGQTQVIATWDTYVTNGPADWRLDPDKFTAEQKDIYQKMEAEVKKANVNYVLDSVMIGWNTETLADNTKKAYPSLIAYVHGPARMGRVPVYKPWVTMDIIRPAFGQIQFAQYPEDRDNSQMDLFKDTDLKALCKQFAATLFGVYTITPNHYFIPTSAELTPNGGGSPIRLLLRAITY